MELNLLHVCLLFSTGVAAGFLKYSCCGWIVVNTPDADLPYIRSDISKWHKQGCYFLSEPQCHYGFPTQRSLKFSVWYILAVPAVIGAGIGAKIAIGTDAALFQFILAAVMLIMLGLTLLNPTARFADRIESTGTRSTVLAMVVFFFIGIYGGFIQAGVGLLVITALRLLTGIDLVRTNAIKVLVIFFYTILALAIFILEKQVDWTLGVTLAIGNATGAWIGSHWAVEKGDKWIKVVLVVAVLVFATNLMLKPFKLDVVSLLGLG